MDRAVLETSSDRYVIVEYLAEGGMGAIYLGKKLGVGGFEKEVVLKQLLPEFTREPKFIDLFLREARLSASLEHANIVHTIDLVNAGDDYFMVMEYVKGGDLRTLLKRVRRRHQRFLPQAGVFIGHEILEALAYAHAKTAPDGRPLNLIHRDISPSNILLSGAGEVKLTDFGIAKASTHRSVFYKVKGKVGYMSPEQARGETVDARSDLFSLGVVLYEVLVGERLFVGDLMSSASQIYAQPIKPPSLKRPEIPGDLDTVILKALSLDPAGRFQSADEFQEALSRVATRHRLLIGASEMASHLRSIAGEEAAAWLKPEAFAERNEPTQAHGTAVLNTSAADDYTEHTGAAQDGFDLSDEDEEDEDSDVDDMMRARNRPPSLPTGELTSVIAVRRGDSEILTRVRSGTDPPLQPLQPRRSEPVSSPQSARRTSSGPIAEFGNDESRSHTLVRDSGQRISPSSDDGRARSQPTAYGRSDARTSDPGRASDAGRSADGARLSEAMRDALRPSEPVAVRQPEGTRDDRASDSKRPSERSMDAGRPSDSGRGLDRSMDGLRSGRSSDPMRSADSGRSFDALRSTEGGSPPFPSSPPISFNTGGPMGGRRLPKSGIRERPRGRAFDAAAAAQPRRPKRLIGIMIVLLLIGIGVALGVAFSGPELEVVDPTAPQPQPGGGAATGRSPSNPAEAPRPTELPSPPPATPATP